MRSLTGLRASAGSQGSGERFGRGRGDEIGQGMERHPGLDDGSRSRAVGPKGGEAISSCSSSSRSRASDPADELGSGWQAQMKGRASGSARETGGGLLQASKSSLLVG